MKIKPTGAEISQLYIDIGSFILPTGLLKYVFDKNTVTLMVGPRTNKMESISNQQNMSRWA